uniref:Acyl-CoA oxidase C-terminal domain-containing protein n=1 Tax=Plectus sambesii TaxID=2011161 RepID=A0A914XDV4_9BILA
MEQDAHVRLYLVKTFLSTVETVKEATLKQALRDLAGLFVFNTIYDCSFSFIEDGYMSTQQIEYVKSALYASLEKLRPNAVALVDSFNVCDRELHSVLGRRDGIVYPNLLEWAKQSDINKLEVLPAFHKYLGPMMKNARSKL